MSTDSPLASADLPTTSDTAAAAAGSSSTASTSSSSSTWSQFGNGNNVGDDLMTLRKRCISNSLENNQNQNQNSLVDMDTEDNNINSNCSNAFSNSSDIDRMEDNGNVEGLSSNSNIFNVGSLSSTAYSFPGSALGSDGVANLKDKLPNATITTNSSNNNSSKTDDPTTNNTTSAGTNNPSSSSSNDDKQDDSMYECNICLDTAKDAVVSMCGHLFCWPCLHQWLETRPNRMLCPVCKAAISKDKVIPLYGRNSAKQEDPRNKVPPRPAGQRTEPEPHTGFQGFGFGDGFHMSFGIGAFPFGYFASSFNFGEPRPGPANRGTAHYEDEQQLSKLFLYLAFLCIAWLLFA